MYAYIYIVCIYIYIYVYIYIYTCVYIYIYVYTYVHMFTYIIMRVLFLPRARGSCLLEDAPRPRGSGLGAKTTLVCLSRS